MFRSVASAVAVFVGLTAFAGEGQSRANTYSFSPDGCDFSVLFPERPEITNVLIPGIGEIPEAEIDDGRGLMRANCLTASPGVRVEFFTNKQLVLSQLQAYAEQNGIGNVIYKHQPGPAVVRAEARGTKKINGRWVTFETVWLISSRSVMSVVTGYWSEEYPSTDISRFLRSISSIENVEKTAGTLNAPRPDIGGLVVYRDMKFPFSWRYPKTWKVTPASHAATRLKIVSDHGLGGDDCSVNATPAPRSRKNTSREFVDALMARKDHSTRGQAGNLPDYEVTKYEPSFLSNVPAVYAVSTYTYKTAGLEIPLQAYQYSLLSDGIVYTLTCRTDPGAGVPDVFVVIFSGFVLTPSLGK